MSVVRALVALEAPRRARRLILVGWVAVGARHARRATAARMLAIPRDIVVHLADPIGVAAAGALHCAPQDRRLRHRAARSGSVVYWSQCALCALLGSLT